MKFCILALSATTLFAQHSFTAGDVEDGRLAFQTNCTQCHGPDGDKVPGIDLGRGKFKRVVTDEDIVKVIQNGIPGTAMPPGAFNDFRAMTIVAYLRSMAASSNSGGAPAGGDPARGKAIFEGKGGCTNCHRVNGNGSRLGPDLTDIGASRRAVELQQSILDPSAEIRPQNRFIKVTTKDGATITGRILNQDVFTLQMIDSKEKLVSLNKSNVKEMIFLEKSPMPSFQGKLSSAELADLVSYLFSLKGIQAQ